MTRSLAALWLALLLVPFASSAEKVAKVIDGDTIVLESGVKVRYIGVDTPETVHPSKPVEFMGKEASDFNKGLVEGKDVRLEYDVQREDKYGRTLAYVYVGDLFVNAELVRMGYAQVSTYPPNVRHVDLFTALQREAREAGRGLWDEAAASKWNSPAPQTDSSRYYITKTGSKYHRGGCRYLSKSAIEITRSEAEARGYGPCSVCIGRSAGATSKEPRSAERYWINSSSNVRHNSSCRYYGNTKKGYYTTKKVGKACGICGG